MRTALLTTLAAAVLATSAGPTLAAPGDLDPSFNGNGKLVFSPAGRAGSVRAVAIQPDGKIILAGSVVDPVDNKHDIAVTRLNVDGTVDQGFGTGGTAIADYRSGQDHTDVTGTAVALQADNKIVVAGTLTVNNNLTLIAVVRLNADGTPDPSFHSATGNLGPGRSVAAASAFAGDVAVDGSGRIVVAGGGSALGAGSSNDFLVARLAGDGSQDSSFGSRGVATIDFGGVEGALGLALTPDGGIVLAGATIANLNAEVAVAKVTGGGVLDTGFGNGGKLTYGFAAADFGWDVVLEPGGKIDVGASGDVKNEFLVTRLTSSGALDNSLNGTNTTTANFGGSGQPHTIALQANGKLVLGGWNADSFAVARFQPGGALDSTFGQAGKQTVGFPGSRAQAYGMALQADGKIVLAGDAGVSVAVARLEGDSAAAGGAPVGVGPAGGGTGGTGGGTNPGSGTSRVPRCGGRPATIVGTAAKDRLKGTRRADVIVGLA